MTATSLPENVDILIVGAGLAGAATAYHLRRSGSPPRVVILEKESLPGTHSSGRNAAFVRELMDHADMQPLGTEGAAMLRRGELADFRRCGLMLVGLGDEDVSQRFPPARGKGQWHDSDGIVDVATLLQAYLAGQDVRCETKLLSWEPPIDRPESRSAEVQQDRLVVHTTRGDFHCRTLVNAAGPWAGRVGGIRMNPLRRHLVQTPPMPGIKADWPFVWHAKDGLYFRPESGGLLLSACDESAGEPGDYHEDTSVLESLAEKLARLQPGLGDLSIKTCWVGQRTFAPDRKFVIGFDPRDRRVFHIAGLGGHGVTTSYAVGRLAAGMILSGKEPAGNPFSPGRLIT